MMLLLLQLLVVSAVLVAWVVMVGVVVSQVRGDLHNN